MYHAIEWGHSEGIHGSDWLNGHVWEHLCLTIPHTTKILRFVAQKQVYGNSPEFNRQASVDKKYRRHSSV